jgi:phosphatidylserine/phosphatidylglycerophosphate/cardiolipin synthase-like enzyme
MAARIALLLFSLLIASVAQAASARTETCFVPAQHCDGRIVAAIDAAGAEIRVQAYGFSSRPILDALVRAHARGVDVQVLLDRSNEQGRRAGLIAMHDAHIPVWIDHVPGIAHVKAIIIDRRVVIGGSYNYTASAEHKNVEDVTISHSPKLAAEFLRQWEDRRAVATSPD